MSSTASAALHPGFDADERRRSPYREFYRDRLAPLSPQARQAVDAGVVAPELLPPVERAAALQAPGYQPVETGYTISADGAARINVLTRMPGVTPAMWDWWFGWHGSEAQRYKLWHPRAHVDVAWADGREDLRHYVGRTSRVVEFVGSTRLALSIRFVAPSSLGFDESRLAAMGEVAICARGALTGTPMETGWLVHQLRPLAGGCEMRSRFWIAGDNVRPRGMPGGAGAVIGGIARRMSPVNATQAAELLVHCAQEMQHLAQILPSLHSTFGHQP